MEFEPGMMAMRKNLRTTLFVLSVIVSSILHGQIQNPPSQRELNGFLIGQDADAIAGGFSTQPKEQKYDDGWIDRVYALDSLNTSFMVFGYPDSLHDCLSIQITGRMGTEMRPFLGLKLGDPREKIIASLGPPSKVQHF